MQPKNEYYKNHERQNKTENYQTIAVEATAKRKNSLMLKKTSFENTARVFSQAEVYSMYTPSMSTSNNYDEAEVNATALLPNFNLKNENPTKRYMETQSCKLTKEHWKDQALNLVIANQWLKYTLCKHVRDEAYTVRLLYVRLLDLVL